MGGVDGKHLEGGTRSSTKQLGYVRLMVDTRVGQVDGVESIALRNRVYVQVGSAQFDVAAQPASVAVIRTQDVAALEERRTGGDR